MCLGVIFQTRTRCLRDNHPQKGICQNSTPIENTAMAGIQPEKLLGESKVNAEAAVDVKLIKTMLERKVASIEIEQVALRMGAGRDGIKKCKISEIKDHRKWENVQKQLSIKLDACIKV